ncbi:hypothetical protein NE237_026753 [Protea cynaroides]|uniref:Uncharacterized protein n=1 Tax=Protea cynaroides TaxID=273540 RepID=A0A9Q0GLT7_9MAGN|nr:hypothetical protein NE237_026753 [Protea cynaroides]
MKPRPPISHAYCPRERKPRVGWVKKYFNDCLCDLKDEISFGCGLVSLISWGVADIPQLYTISTVVLVWQCIYYDHICRWWKSKKKEPEETAPLLIGCDIRAMDDVVLELLSNKEKRCAQVKRQRKRDEQKRFNISTWKQAKTEMCSSKETEEERSTEPNAEVDTHRCYDTPLALWLREFSKLKIPPP